MKIPVIRGLIRRRILVNYRADPAAVARMLPAGFEPRLANGHGMVGVCLIRLEAMRPDGLPAVLGLASENAAHRVGVWYRDGTGQPQPGVYIPRRDTGSTINRLAGGRLFPGEHHAANFQITDRPERIDFAMTSHDGQAVIRLTGRPADALPPTSCFRSLPEASAYFEAGADGFSVTSDPARFDGVRLVTEGWSIQPLHIDALHASWFEDPARFPAGSVVFDHALVMRDLPHTWRGVGE